MVAPRVSAWSTAVERSVANRHGFSCPRRLISRQGRDRVERKLAAILAADVVGYSRLMGEDEAGTLSALKTLRMDFIEPLVVAHRGRIVTLMAEAGSG